MSHGRRPLPLFLGLSCALHLAVLLCLPAPPSPPARHWPGEAGLSVTLTRAAAGTGTPVPAPAAARHAATSRPPRPRAAPAPAASALPDGQATAGAVPAAAPAPESHPADMPAAGNPAAAGVPLLTALRDAMQPYFHYPLLARRHGWEGTVRIGMRISASGQISRLHIVETSHHAVLDQAALDCLVRIRQLPGAVAWLDGHDSDIVLPVEYRLTDS